MADEPIDLNKVRNMNSKDRDIGDNLHALFHAIAEAHNQLKMRARDLEKDADELFLKADAIMAEIMTKYPELMPDLEGEDDEAP